MSTIDPIDAALDALVAYFGTALAGQSITVRKGWPEEGVKLSLRSGSVLSVAAIPGGQVATHSPYQVDQTGTGTLTVTYRVGTLGFTVQLDLWAAYKATREAKAVLVEAALSNRLPWSPDLLVTSTNYYGRPITATRTGARFEGEEGASQRGQWRRSWDLRIGTDLVVQTTHPELIDLHLIASTVLGSTTVTEPAVEFIPDP
jgi:hypothetical protein